MDTVENLINAENSYLDALEKEIRSDGRRKFAKWCKNNNVQCRKKVDGEWIEFSVSDIVAEYEKEQENGNDIEKAILMLKTYQNTYYQSMVDRLKDLAHEFAPKLKATTIKDEHERILNEIREKANEYCKNVSCNMECVDCEHGAFVREIVKIVKNSAE